MKLYPPIRENWHIMFPVDDIHTLYIEESGNPAGVPVVFLHGGPGAGCAPWHRQFFDPEHYRIILFDQRGCGRSTPHAELQANTTWDLVADLEKIRKELAIERWLVFGGSWGSTLGLAYAETHPERVSALIMRGIFLGRPTDIAWFYQAGANRIFPDYWEDFVAPIPVEERDNLLAAYYQRLTGSNEIARMQAAKAWASWEGRTINLKPLDTSMEHFTNPHTAMSVARIEAHYFMHACFLEANQLIRDAQALKDIPGMIIHGRYDMICPLSQAHELHQAWPHADFTVVPACGHAASELGIQSALVKASNFMLEQLS